MIAFLSATIFFAAESLAFKAAFLSGFFAEASAFLKDVIFEARTLDFLASTLAVCFLAEADALTN